MTIHSWPLQISAISVASYFHVYTCFIAKVFLHGLNFSNCILGRFRYQLFKLPVTFTSAKLIFLFLFYIGFQVLVVSWAHLFYSEGVFGVDITHFCQ